MEKSSTLKNSILSGAVSGSITALMFQPFEYVKTQLQQPKRIHHLTQSQTIRHVINETLIENEKFKVRNLTRFWSGLSPSLIRSVPVAGIYFGCIDTFKNTDVFKHAKHGGTYQSLHSFIIGSLSKVLADVTTFPLGLIKTRYESGDYKYKSILNAFYSIAKTEGFFNLYRGFYATIIRDVTYSGVYFTLYTEIKSIAKEHITENQKRNSAYFASCALVSSIISCAFTQPPDVIRSYMQLDPKNYNSFMSTARVIYQKKGINGFLVGFLPRTLRRTLISVMSWTIYEKFTITKE